jgi:prepilin peptidase CpaA
MYKPFFPNIPFAWAFLVLLGAVLIVAAYVDWKRTTIPKWLTLSLLGLGVAVGVLRGAWLGGQGEKLWLLPTDSVLLGALDGFLFALIGCVSGFFMIFVLWLMGTCGGGDVKLFAALGSWVGPVYTVFVLAGSLVVLFLEILVKLVTVGFSFKAIRKEQAKRQKGEKVKPGQFRVTYSLPVAVATVLVLLWFFRVELGLAQPGSPQNTNKVQAHVR